MRREVVIFVEYLQTLMVFVVETVYARLHLNIKIVIMKTVVYLRNITFDEYAVGCIYIWHNISAFHFLPNLHAILWKVT